MEEEIKKSIRSLTEDWFPDDELYIAQFAEQLYSELWEYFKDYD